LAEIFGLDAIAEGIRAILYGNSDAFATTL
jgi:hypothetical protein